MNLKSVSDSTGFRAGPCTVDHFDKYLHVKTITKSFSSSHMSFFFIVLYWDVEMEDVDSWFMSSWGSYDFDHDWFVIFSLLCTLCIHHYIIDLEFPSLLIFAVIIFWFFFIIWLFFVCFIMLGEGRVSCDDNLHTQSYRSTICTT